MVGIEVCFGKALICSADKVLHKICYIGTDAAQTAQVTVIQAQLAAIGINVELCGFDQAGYMATAYDNNDETYDMYLGGMVELGDGEEVFHNPQHPYTKALISAIPIADSEIGKKTSRIPIKGELPSPMNVSKGCRFATCCPHVTDKCWNDRPEFREIKPGHFVACYII